jgi:hypothetical protein
MATGRLMGRLRVVAISSDDAGTRTIVTRLAPAIGAAPVEFR